MTTKYQFNKPKGRREDFIGREFNRLTVIDFAGVKGTVRTWWCKCSCGKLLDKPVSGSALKSGHSKSCGCYAKEQRKRATYRGYKELSGYKLNRIRQDARKRGINIGVTPEYLYNLMIDQNYKCKLSGISLNFDQKSGHSLDRIDSSIDYIEGNVQWVHKDVNFMKRYFNQQYFIDTCKLITVFNGNFTPINDYTTKQNINFRGYRDISLFLFNEWMASSQKRSLGFNLTLQDIWQKYLNQGGVCSLTGTPIAFATNRKNNTASIDRIDSSRGYYQNNIQIVHKDINIMKYNYSQDYFKHLCKLVADNNTI